MNKQIINLIQEVCTFDRKYLENRLQKCYLGNFKGIKIYSVNGAFVRKTYEIDFVAGGHDKVYEFVEENSIYLDNNLEQNDMKYILLHEYIERWFMINKDLSYDAAHKIANKYEKIMRNE